MCFLSCWKQPCFVLNCPSRAKTKKRISLVLIATYFLLTGIEYVIILPTAWLYIRERFDGDSVLLGLAFAVYCLAGLLCGPIFGWISDCTGNTKAVFLLGATLHCVGSTMYFMGISGWFIVLSRFVEGCGTGLWSSLMGDIARITDSSERTGVMSIIMSVRQFGLIFGPSLNLVLQLPHFYIGPFVVDKYTSNGAFMTVLWVLLFFTVLIFYRNLPEIHEMQRREEEAEKDERTKVVSLHKSLSTSNISALNTELTNIDGTDDKHTDGDKRSEEPATPVNVWSWSFIYDEFVREEVIVILAVAFGTFFNEIALETMIMPLAQKMLYFGVTENSALYMFGGVVILLGFTLTNRLSKFLPDRVILIIGLIMEILALIVGFGAVPTAVPGELVKNGIITVVIMLLTLIGLPFLLVSCTSLLSKVTSRDTQGFTQGVKGMFESVGAIMGPLWAGAAIDRPYVLFGVMLAIQSIFLVMSIVSYDYLIDKSIVDVDTMPMGQPPDDVLDVPPTPTTPITPNNSCKSQ